MDDGGAGALEDSVQVDAVLEVSEGGADRYVGHSARATPCRSKHKCAKDR